MCKKIRDKFNYQGKNTTIIKQIVEAKLENDYYFKLHHLLKTSYPVKKIDLRYFSHLLVESKNYICQYSQFWIFKDLYILMLKKVHYQISSGHLRS